MPITILCQAAPVFSQRKSITVLSPHPKNRLSLKIFCTSGVMPYLLIANSLYLKCKFQGVLTKYTQRRFWFPHNTWEPENDFQQSKMRFSLYRNNAGNTYCQTGNNGITYHIIIIHILKNTITRSRRYPLFKSPFIHGIILACHKYNKTTRLQSASPEN